MSTLLNAAALSLLSYLTIAVVQCNHSCSIFLGILAGTSKKSKYCLYLLTHITFCFNIVSNMVSTAAR